MQCNDINYCKCADRCFMLLFLPFSCSRVFIISNAIRLGKKKYQGVLAKIKFPTYVNFFLQFILQSVGNVLCGASL